MGKGKIMAKDFLSDEEMGQLEQASPAATPEIISDEQMEQMSVQEQQTPVEDEGGAVAALRGFLSQMPGAKQSSSAVLATVSYVDNLANKEVFEETGTKRPSWAELYREQRDATSDVLKQDQEQHPIASTLGSVAGAITSIGAPGGVATKAIGAPTFLQRTILDAGFSAINPVIDEVENSVLNEKNPVLGISSAVVQSARNALIGNAIGTGIVKGGQAILPTASKYLSQAIDDTPLYLLKNTVQTKYASVRNGLEQVLNKHATSHQAKIAVAEEANALIKEIGVPLDDVALNPVDFMKRVTDYKKALGSGIESGYKAIDDSLGPMALSMNNVWHNIERRVLDYHNAAYDDAGKLLSTSSVKDAEKAGQILRELKKEFFERQADGAVISRAKGAGDLWNFRQSFNDSTLHLFPSLQGNLRDLVGGEITDALKSIRTNPNQIADNFLDVASANVEKAKGKLLVAQSAKQSIDDAVAKAPSEVVQDPLTLQYSKKPVLGDLGEKAASVNKGLSEAQSGVKEAEDAYGNAHRLYNQFIRNTQNGNPGKEINALSRKYELLSDLENNVFSKMRMPKTEGGFIAATVRNLKDFRSVAGAGIGALAGGPLGAATGALTGAMLKTAAKKIDDGLTPSATLKLSNKMIKTSDLLNSLGDRINDPTVAKIAGSVFTAISNQALSDDEVYDYFESANAQLSLYDNPLDRNDESIKARMDDVMNILATTNPEAAQQLANMVDNQEDMGPTMDTFSKTPGMQKLFKKGLGWNGRVYSDEDKFALINKVNSLPSVSSWVKMDLNDKIMKNGIIPDFNAIPSRSPLQYNPRDKKRER